MNEKRNTFKNICELLQHSPTFLLAFLRASLSKKVRLRTLLACSESNFSNFKFEYLCEKEVLRKTILACLSGAQMGSIHEKNIGRKSRDTAPLKDSTCRLSIFRPGPTLPDNA